TRFGDPECQVLMMRLKDDLLPVLDAAARGGLEGAKLNWTDDVALTVVMAAKGYPEKPVTGTEIKNLAEAETSGAKIFHAGTALKDGKLIATGGRVLNVTALGGTVASAKENAYAAVKKIDWDGGFYRTDIGF